MFIGDVRTEVVEMEVALGEMAEGDECGTVVERPRGRRCRAVRRPRSIGTATSSL